LESEKERNSIINTELEELKERSQELEQINQLLESELKRTSSSK
jgi:hypothetical protein